MNDQNLSTSQPPAEWRASRREWRHSIGQSWVGGLVLITLGIILLLEKFSPIHSDHWWALLILIPAIGSFITAWNFHHQTGRLTRPARGALFGGLILVMIAATFLFDWNWELTLPILLIVAGISALINSMLPD
jgi:hypothetical protein